MEMNLYQAIKAHLWFKVEPLTYSVVLKRNNQDTNKPFFHNLNEILPSSVKNELLKENVVFFEFSEIITTGNKKVIAKDKNDTKSYLFNDNIGGDEIPWNKFVKHLIEKGDFTKKMIRNKTIDFQVNEEDKKLELKCLKNLPIII